MRVHPVSLFPLSVLVLSFAACSGSGSGTDASDARDVPGDLAADTLPADLPVGDSDVTEEGQPDVPPAFNPVLAASLQALIDEQIAFSPDPGMTLTVRTADGAWWSGAAGMANLATKTPMNADTAFRVGSNTKPFVAATILQLVEEGSVDLEAPLTTYLPEYAEWSDITVRLLMNMRSGLKDYLAITSLMIALIADPTTSIAPREILEYVRAEPRLFQPDMDGSYTNTSYLLLGLIIEEVTGNPADQEIDRRIIQPLGLANTYLDMGTRTNDNLADGYIDFGLAGPALGLPASTEGLLPDPVYVDGLLVGTGLIHPTVNWTAGSMVSTSRDMAVLIHALMDGNLLKPESVVKMKETVLAKLFNGMVQYGLGLQIRPTNQGDEYGHGGLNFGYQAATYYFPDNGVTISHLHNFLLDSYDSFQDEMMKLILAGGDANFTACTRPDDLFKTFDTAPYLNVSFKGKVNLAATTPKIFGNASLRLATADGPKPFTGIFPSAALQNPVSGPNVTITGYGLPSSGDADLVITSLVLGEALFTGLDANGRKVVTQDNLGDMFLMVANGYYQEGSTEVVERLCYTALSDPTRLGEAMVCKGTGALPVEGDTLRLFGTVPYTDDAATVSAVLTAIGIPACVCLVDGAYQECP